MHNSAAKVAAATKEPSFDDLRSRTGGRSKILMGGSILFVVVVANLALAARYP